MSVTETADLVLTELAPDEGESTPDPPGRSLSDLVPAQGSANSSLSGQVELATTLEELRVAGLVETRTDADPGQPAFVLTEEGRERAATVRDSLADTTVEVVDEDGRRDRPLAAVADEQDRSLVAVAADCTDDGVYYVEDEPDGDRLVGRDAERERCRTVLERVREESAGRALFLTGAGGVGKTALADTLLEWAGEEGFAVARARCQRAGEPYGPLRELLTGLDAPESPFADAADLTDEIDDHEQLRAQRTGLFYEITGALASTDADRPCVCYLDDVHRADAATMAYLEYLLEHLADRPLALVGSYRPAELAADAPVRADAVGAADDVTHLRLEPLDAGGTRGVVERVLERRGVPDAFVAAVHERTDGNPLFVEETVRMLVETGQLDPGFEWYPDEAAAIDVPDAVSETIHRQIAALEDDAAELLRWAAVIGERVPVDVLESVAAVESTRFHTLLEALVGADVFERAADRDAVSFRNGVVREALVDDLSAAERRRRHDAVAAVLEDAAVEAVGGDDVAGQRAAAVATHHERAGNAERAIEWYRRAGERATTVYAHDGAVDHYHSALALAKESGDRETVLSVAERLAEIYISTGEFGRADQYATFVRERTEGANRRQRMALLAARIANARGEYESTVRRVDDGLALEETPSRTRCRLLFRKAGAERKRGEFERATETATALREEAAAVGADDMVAAANKELGVIAATRGDNETARDHLRDALATFRASEKLLEAASTRTALGNVARSRGEFETAREHYERALETSREVGSKHHVSIVRHNLGLVAVDRGEFESAREHYRRALREARAVGLRQTALFARMNLGEVTMERGEFETARKRVREAIEGAEEIGDSRLLDRANLVGGTLSIETNEYDLARERLRAALEEAEEIGDRQGVGRARALLGRLATAEGEYETARDHLRDALEELRAIDASQFVARARLFCARLALETGSTDDARGHLKAALVTYEDIGARHGVARARKRLAELAAERDRYLPAAELLESALATFEDVGATLDALETLELLVECCRERGDDADARAWVHRGATLLETVDDDALRANHEWIGEKHEAGG